MIPLHSRFLSLEILGLLHIRQAPAKLLTLSAIFIH